MSRRTYTLAARALAAALTAALLGGSVAGCSDEDPPVEPETPRPDATFTAELTRTAGGLRWAYRLRNNESAGLIAFNGPDADRPTDPPAVWITRRDDETVEVAQRLLGPPEDVEVARPMLVHGSIVAPGAELTGAAEVRLPLSFRHPYSGAFDPAPDVPGDAERVVFCVGVARKTEFVPQPTEPPTEPPTATPTGQPGPIYAHLAGSLRRQHLFCSEPADLRR